MWAYYTKHFPQIDVPESLFDEPSDEGKILDIFSCSHFFRSQNPHHVCVDLLLYIRMPG